MKNIKIIFNQGLLISTAMLLLLGIDSAAGFILRNEATVQWQWYIPLSIILTGFLCALPTYFLLSAETPERKGILLRIVLHFLSVGAVVSFCGYLFGWFTSAKEYSFLIVGYVVIYVMVWVVSSWLVKTDEKKINEAIKALQDEE